MFMMTVTCKKFFYIDLRILKYLSKYFFKKMMIF